MLIENLQSAKNCFKHLSYISKMLKVILCSLTLGVDRKKAVDEEDMHEKDKTGDDVTHN